MLKLFQMLVLGSQAVFLSLDRNLDNLLVCPCSSQQQEHRFMHSPNSAYIAEGQFCETVS